MSSLRAERAAPLAVPGRRAPAALRAAAQIAVSAGLVAWATSKLDLTALAARGLRPGWLALGLLSTCPPYLAAALRWSLTARRLGLPLPFPRALSELYAAGLLNALLPTGFAGEFLRVARHGAQLAALARGEIASDAGVGQAQQRGRARSAEAERAPYLRSLQAVALERASGQLVLWSALLLGLGFWPGVKAWQFALAVLTALAALAATGRLLAQLRPALGQRLDRALGVVRTALFAEGVWRAQLATSTAVVLGCAATFACCTCALGVPASGSTLMRVVPPLLAVSALPISIGGFGVRELASAALYGASGLEANTGIAVAGLYGLLNLAGSLPGALCLRRT